MEWHSPLLEKSYDFAVRIAIFCREIQTKQKEYVLTKQLLRSGTSIGANIAEATQGQSRNDFISKLSIALKEAHETRYWLRIIRDAGIASSAQVDAFFPDLQEIIRMLAASLRTSRAKL
ncbi:four helix bundle protein [Candidatus Peregrinibacteria bacterium]|nr:four helix bundle protein [Candidatus Peregrinibacteria bacterium]MBI3816676.1 four helix bundle protein [Candidatus Peregrinibacteria bacterium]